MKFNVTSNIFKVGVTALAGGAPLLALAAAPGNEYLPHPGLTPYQIVTGVGGPQEKCIEAKPVGASAWEPTLALCDASSNAQRFYVLKAVDSSDFVPQKDGFSYPGFRELNAQIVLAAEWDKNPGGQYAYLAYNPQATPMAIGVTLSKSQSAWRTAWRIERPLSQWVHRAYEGSQFQASQGGDGVKRLRYGAYDGWKYKDAKPNEPVYCSNDSFGGDPRYGTQKACYEWKGSSVDTPLLVHILAGSTRCVVDSTGSLGTSEGSGCESAQAKWTLRPANHPR